jgi:hypothetical protein
MGPNHTPLCDIYIDESSQNGHRHLVLGGILVPTLEVTALVSEIMKARLPELPHGEMKWAKVSRTKLSAYKRVMDLFFSRDLADVAHFHSLVVDLTQQNNAAFNEGNREIGFNKEVFQLARKFGRLYPGRFHVYVDERKTDQRTEELRLMLNRHVHKTQPQRDWPYRRVQFRDSSATPILQVTDILTGAIAYKMNGHDKAENASPAKCELAEYVLSSAGIRDVSKGTAVGGKFTIWHRRLKKVVP